MSLPRTILVLSSATGPMEPALETLAKRGDIFSRLGQHFSGHVHTDDPARFSHLSPR